MGAIILALCFTTCINGCQTVAEGLQLQALTEKTNAILENSINNFDVNNVILENDESEIKREIYEANQNFHLLNSRLMDSFSKILNADESYNPSTNENYTKVRIKNKNFLEEQEIDSLFGDLLLSNIDTNVYINKGERVKDRITPFQMVLPPFWETGTGGEIKQFEIYDVDEAKMQASANGLMDGSCFVGILCNKETCISFYNTVAQMLNNVLRNTASQMRGPAAMIYQFASLAFPLAVAEISSYFAGFYQPILLAIKAGGPHACVIAFLVASFVGTIIGILTAMFISGYNKKGFAVGWTVKAPLDWRWYHGFIE